MQCIWVEQMKESIVYQGNQVTRILTKYPLSHKCWVSTKEWDLRWCLYHLALATWILGPPHTHTPLKNEVYGTCCKLAAFRFVLLRPFFQLWIRCQNLKQRHFMKFGWCASLKLEAWQSHTQRYSRQHKVTPKKLLLPSDRASVSQLTTSLPSLLCLVGNTHLLPFLVHCRHLIF